jgi:hypothetical protein
MKYILYCHITYDAISCLPLLDFLQVWDYTGLGYTKYDARDVDKEVLG